MMIKLSSFNSSWGSRNPHYGSSYEPEVIELPSLIKNSANLEDSFLSLHSQERSLYYSFNLLLVAFEVLDMEFSRRNSHNRA